MTKQLLKAIASGKVSVQNKTAGEVMVVLPNPDGPGFLSIPIQGYGKAELAPKHLPANMIAKSRNLLTLVSEGRLRIL